MCVSPSGLARLVSEAQSKEAPVQRLADEVAGRFCYGETSRLLPCFGGGDQCLVGRAVRLDCCLHPKSNLTIMLV